MSKLLDPKQVIRFQPELEKHRPEAERRAYLLRPPLVKDRVKLRALTRELGGAALTDAERMAAMSMALNRLSAEAEPGQLDDALAALLKVMELFDAFRVAYQAAIDNPGDGELVMASSRALQAWSNGLVALAPVEEAIEAVDPGYRRLIGAAAAFPLARGTAAAMLLLVGWEGYGDGPPRRHAGLVEEAALARIPERDLIAIGGEVERLLSPSEAEAKNSESPSPGPSSATASSETPTTPPPSAP